MFFLDLQTLRAGDEGWLVLDVTAASDRWLLNRNKDLGLRLYVETEDGKTRGRAANLLRGAPPRLLSAGAAGTPSIGLEAPPFHLALPSVGVSEVKRAKFPQFWTAEGPYCPSLLSRRTNTGVAESESMFPLPKKRAILSLWSCLLHWEFLYWAGH